MDTTTKTKHPGRVAQGHKLVALNKERKAALKEQPEQQPEQQAEQQPAQQSQTSTVVYGGGAIAILIFVGGALYLYTRRATPATLSTPATPSTPVNPSALDNDIFCMN